MLRKVLVGEKVYIPINELAMKGLYHLIAKDINPYEEKLEDFGICIEEQRLNAALLSNSEAFEANGNHIEMTRIDSLDVRIKNIKSIAPLKFLFFLNYEKDKKTVEKMIAEDEKKEKERIINEFMSEKERVKKYKKLVEFYTENKNEISSILSKHGLSLQFLTEISNKAAGMIGFLVGKGVFYHIWNIEDWGLEDYRNIETGSDGEIIIQDPQEEEPEIIPADRIVRDFSSYTASENLIWCLYNLDLKNDYTDEFNYMSGGINFMFKSSLFVKLINHKAFPEFVLIDGMVEIDEKVTKTYL